MDRRITTLGALMFGAALFGAVPAMSQSFLEKGKSLFGSITKSLPGGTLELAIDEIAAGLREALKIGIERVVGTVGRADWFKANPEIHIPLPGSLARVQSTLKTFGASGLADDLELRLNRAAKAAAPKA